MQPKSQAKFRAFTILGRKKDFIYFDFDDMNEYNWEIFDEEVIFQVGTSVNGVNVYEGDIISATIDGFAGGDIEKHVVKFQNGLFGIQTVYDFYPLHQLLNMQVTGNVYIDKPRT